MDILPSWDHEKWLSAFHEENADHHVLRRQVWENTLKIVQNKGYVTQNRTSVALELRFDHSKYYSRPLLAPNNKQDTSVEITVLPRDCLEIAKEWTEANIETAVLNMANQYNPGGGVRHGAGAQEEYLFRCSDYYRFLYPYGEHAEEYDLRSKYEHYPLDRNFGGIFAPGVTVFRGSEETGYPLLEKPWKVNLIAVAGINHPETYIAADGEERIISEMTECVKNKIRTIFRIALENRQRDLVLGALGCGAFNNPPRHVAELFRDVLCEPEFENAFHRICFAVKSRRHSNGGENFQAFYSVLNGFQPSVRFRPVLFSSGRMKEVNVFYEVYTDRTVRVSGSGVLSFNLRDFNVKTCCDGAFHVKVEGDFHTVGSRAFFDWISLSSIQLPRSVRRIERCAFSDCDNLNVITMPGDIEYIDENAFEYTEPKLIVFYGDRCVRSELLDYFIERNVAVQYKGLHKW